MPPRGLTKKELDRVRSHRYRRGLTALALKRMAALRAYGGGILDEIMMDRISGATEALKLSSGQVNRMESWVEVAEHKVRDKHNSGGSSCNCVICTSVREWEKNPRGSWHGTDEMIAIAKHLRTPKRRIQIEFEQEFGIQPE